MAPITTASNEETHGALLDTLDLMNVPKPFRNPNYKPAQRRNKTLKQIQFLSEQLASSQALQRETQSVLNTQQNSGANTPLPLSNLDLSNGAAYHQSHSSALPNNNNNNNNSMQGVHRLLTTQTPTLQPSGANTPTPLQPATAVPSLPSVTYSSISAAPSLKPKKKYCDITGRPAKYTDPQTGLNYCNAEVYQFIRRLTTTQVQDYLELRGAHTVLK